MTHHDLDVGARIRAFRKRNKLSLNELSKLTGIAASNLSSIELNKSSPTLATLLRIATAFDMSVGALLDQVLPTTASVCRNGEGGTVETPVSGITVHNLTGNIYRAALGASLICLAPGSTAADLGTISADRFMYVLEGGATIVVDEEKIELAAGDSVYAAAEAHVVIENREQAAARLLVVRAICSSWRP
ncbi:MAG: helix-turn-helix domain-containing protein [Desulfomonile sp.]|nr:helix-turn-helix domain-containing protein [Desulfomonile sp.]